MNHKTRLRVKQLVAFSILMQKEPGIISKSPDYILEKIETVSHLEEELIPQLLHPTLHHEYSRYLKAWERCLRNDLGERKG